MNLFDQTVTRLRGTPMLDPYSGQETDIDWSAPDRLDLAGSLQPLQGQRGAALTFDRDTITTRFWLFVEGAPDLLDTDHVEYDGAVFEIEGQVQRWVGGGLDYAQAMLKKVAG